ncbi:hypothetical protein CTI12_AA209190 [Artemisia annua]|uniref:Uncharacterized protein n=1 Tax=Artemisia annua TaxID=35608 RepID=A0A2U1NY58_ARTAN|nr:hypothetical protein CTI12_AA209190 [Artemisia annua]
MDFHTLNRRQLQSLCKLNKIPANITNAGMADALGSLEIVEGIEEILNPSLSETAGSSVESPEKMEVTSPRVPRTSYRTSTRQKVKKTDTDYLPVTVNRTNSRGVRRQLAGEVNEFVKTPLVSGTRKKAPTTVQKVITVQSVYNTRRSARLAEKKCPEAGVIGRETSQAVKIGSFLEDVGVTLDKDSGNFVSENSVGSGFGSMETSHESSVSSENTEGTVMEESVESCDVGVSKEKVEDICNAFEKLDVVVDGTNQNLTAEKAQHVATLESEEKIDNSEVKSVEMLEQHENLELNETQNDAEKFVVNEFDTSEVKNDVDELNPDSEGISSPCEEGESEESFMAVNEKIDRNEALNGSVEEHNVCLQVDNLKRYSEVISNPLEDENSEDNLMITDEKIDTSDEAWSVSVKEHNVYLQVDNLKPNSEGIPSQCVDEEFEDSSVVVGEKNDISEALNDSVKEQNVHFQVDNLKTDLEVISSPCVNVDSEENLRAVDEKNDINEALNETVKEQNVYLQVESVKADSEVISNISEAVEFEENFGVVNEKHDTAKALNDTVKEQNDYSQVDNLKADTEMMSSICEDVVLEEVLEVVDERNDLNEGLNIPVKEEDVHSHEDILNSDSEDVSNPSEDGDSEEEWMVVNEKSDVDETSSVSVEEQNSLHSEEDVVLEVMEVVDERNNLNEELEIPVKEKDVYSHEGILNSDSEDVSNPSEDGDSEEEWMVVNEKSDIEEASSVSVEEQNSLHSEEDSDSVLSDRTIFLSDIDGSDADPFSSDTENPNGVTVLKLANMFPGNSKMMNEDSECNGSPNMGRGIIHFNTENPFELSKIESSDNHNVAKELNAEVIDENISTIIGTLNNNANSSEVSELASLDNHIVAKIIPPEGIYENISENTGSPNTVDDLICSDDENPSELLELESSDNHTGAKVMTAEGIEDNISKSTVDMVLFSPNELESGLDYSAPGEAQECLMNETDIELNPDQVNQEAEQIISDGDKADPENSEQAIEEAEQIISDADKADPELNPEQVNQEAEQIISDGDKADPELNREQVNQEAGQIISDGDKVTHESVYVSDFTGNQFSTNANDDINNPTYLTSLKKQALSDTPASKTGLTQVSENNENSGRELQAVIGEEDKSINENVVDEKPVRHEISIRQLKKQLKKLSIKKNSDTNKDDKVAEARPALKAVCENQLATTETDN